MNKAESQLFLHPERVTPIIGAVADSGQLVRLMVDAGVDFLLALSAGFYRNQGASTLAPYLPFANSNDLTERLLHEQILPRAGVTPVIAGFLPGDPTVPLSDRLDRLLHWGVAGVINYPSVTLLDGSFRYCFEEEGLTLNAELALLAEARQRGLRTVGFVGPDAAAARRFAGSGVDALIFTAGLTRQLEDVQERRDRLQHTIRQLNVCLDAARTVQRRLPCLVFGGPITMPEDLEEVFRQSTADGFVGGSVFSRLPIQTSVPAAIRRFKSVTTRRADERRTGLGPLIGASGGMRQLFRMIERAAGFDFNVCIEGESGVGKELVANQIHHLSRRAHGPLVTLNCGAIPDSLLESELFGHERGAFTGADHRRLGKFELADNGTLFLDEVGDLSPRGQVALLRAIQQREITRVGGEAPIPVNTRILSATNQPLARLVEQGRFRADLYYRLNSLTLAIPPLRERLDDLPLLLAPLLAALRVEMNRELTDLSPRFHEKLRRHAWPGNLRELQHVICQAALLEEGPLLEGQHFMPMPASVPRMESLSSQVAADVREVRQRQLRQALVTAGGNKSRAAALLGITRKTLYAWLKEFEAEEKT